ncbi:cytochrome P450, putative [Ricinus communis]|uniref:Cytochrome P450, putative n=1 Tax=Ricinus communis TaxID=3988 RepID=B9T0P7_RICCO|nr:cytochrome P450, putative [Ricinus communis]
MEDFLAEVVWLVILAGFCILLLRVSDTIWLKPRRIRLVFLKQGIGGPRPRFLYGNIQEMQEIQEMVMKSTTQKSHLQPALSHNAWVCSIFPHLQLWEKQYGRSTYLSDPIEPIVGNSIIRANGHNWDHQKKLIAPEFYPHKLKLHTILTLSLTSLTLKATRFLHTRSPPRSFDQTNCTIGAYKLQVSSYKEQQGDMETTKRGGCPYIEDSRGSPNERYKSRKSKDLLDALLDSVADSNGILGCIARLKSRLENSNLTKPGPNLARSKILTAILILHRETRTVQNHRPAVHKKAYKSCIEQERKILREKEMEGYHAETFWSVAIVGFCILLIRVCDAIWLKPRRIRSVLLKQGIGGPRPCFLYGNVQEMQKIQAMVAKTTQTSHVQPASSSHNAWAYSIFPHFHQWAQQYGRVYTYTTWSKQHLYVGEPELMKALNLNTSLDLGRSTHLSNSIEPMVGNGIIRANGPYWAHQKKLIAPEFFLHKIKRMSGLMEECTLAMIRTWQNEVESKEGVADITIDRDLKSLAGDIISKACFGSSYSQGKQIFATLEALQEATSKPIIQRFGLKNFRFLPTKSNREIWRLQKEVKTQILKVVKARRGKSQRTSKPEDLLDALLQSVADSKEIQHPRDAERFIVDNCKNIYFAGHETTALSASWCLMLLALHPEWQERVRAEIVEICGDRLHDSLLDLDKLHQHLDIGYGIAPRSDNWGEDANEFRPERFAQGITEACKYPQSYIPFGFGSRLCIGKTFAMLELKIILSLILTNFSFSLSPEYHHIPVYKIALSPKQGIRLLAKSVLSGPNNI